MINCTSSYFPEEIVELIFKNCDENLLLICSQVCNLWHKIAVKFCLEAYQTTLKDLRFDNVLRWYPSKLITAFGKSRFVSLKELKNLDIDDIHQLQPDQMSDNFMRGFWKGLPFLAFKYQDEIGQEGVEVYVKRADAVDEDEWVSTSYHNQIIDYFQPYYMSDDYFSQIATFISHGEANLPIVSTLTQKIYCVIPIEPQQTPIHSRQKFTNKISKNCMIS